MTQAESRETGQGHETGLGIAEFMGEARLTSVGTWGAVFGQSGAGAAGARSMPMGTVDRRPAMCGPLWALTVHLVATDSHPGG